MYRSNSKLVGKNNDLFSKRKKKRGKRGSRGRGGKETAECGLPPIRQLQRGLPSWELDLMTLDRPFSIKLDVEGMVGI